MRSLLSKLLTTSGMLALAGSNLFAGNVVNDLLADLAGPQTSTYLDYRYGYENTLGGAFTSFNTLNSNGALQYFNPGPGVPIVGADPNGGTHFSSVVAASNEAILHPGQQGQYAILRYIAPVSGNYSVNGLFSGQDMAGTTTDVHILINGASDFDAGISGFSGIGGGTASGINPSQIFSLSSLALTTGDTIDFAVGYGWNNDYTSDSTGLQATIQSVASTPEPGSLGLLFAGVSLLVAGKIKFRRSN